MKKSELKELIKETLLEMQVYKEDNSSSGNDFDAILDSKFINKLTSYEQAVKVISQMIDAYIEEYGEPPFEDDFYKTLKKAAKKFNKTVDELIKDLTNHVSTSIGKDPNEEYSYEQLIYDYGIRMYKGLLKHITPMKDIPKQSLISKIPEDHVEKICKRYNKAPTEVMDDIYDQFQNIKRYGGVNESS